MRALRPGETLDGHDLAVFSLPYRRKTRQRGLSVENDGTGTTVALVAALLRASETDDIAERLKKREMRWHSNFVNVAVHLQSHNFSSSRHGDTMSPDGPSLRNGIT